MNYYDLNKYITTSDYFEIYLASLFETLLVSLMMILALVLTIWIISKVVQYRNASPFESFLLQNTLKKENFGDHLSILETKTNWLIKQSTVRFQKNKIILRFPTKFWWQVTSRLDLTKEVNSRISSKEFREYLKIHFSGYVFSEAVRKNNSYVIIGKAY